MLQVLRSLSVIWKLLIMIGLAVSVGVGLLLWESGHTVKSGMNEVAKLNRSDVASLFSDNVSGGIRWNKLKAIEDAYAELVGKSDSTISDLITWDREGNILTRYRSERLPPFGLDTIGDLSRDELIYEDVGTHAWVVVPVSAGKDAVRVGTLAIAFTNERLNSLVCSQVGVGALFSLVGLIILLVLIGLVSRSVIGRPLVRANQIARGIADGELNQTVDILGKDEIGQLGHSMSVMIRNIKKDIEETRARADEASRIRMVLDVCSTNVIVADVDDRVIYQNQSSICTLQDYQDALRSDPPNLDLQHLVGSDIKQFHPDPVKRAEVLK